MKPPDLISLEHATLAAIVESSDDAIVSKDLNGVIMSWNKGAERIFGYTAAEVIGKPVTILIPPERNDEEPTILGRILRGERIDHYETVRRRKDGTAIDISLTVSPVRDAEGRVVGASKIARDISARKQAEMTAIKLKNELARVNEELERRVRERTQDLERANASLVREFEERQRLEEQLRQTQKLESIGTLAGGIAHDFNNILNIIAGYTSLLGRICSADKKVRGALQVIEESIDRASSVVRQLLAMGRKTEIKFEEIDVNSILEKLKGLLSETFPKTIDISLRLDPKLPSVVADSTQMTQALLNLYVNARDAMPDGGRLYIETGTVTRADLGARFSQAKEAQYVYIIMRDTGTGIDETIKHRIFDPFFTTKELGKGSGLGLSVVYGIVTKHAGFIDVMSEPSHGATFTIYLPIAEERDRPVVLPDEQEPKDVTKSSTNGQTILLVDDEIKQLDLMQSVLEEEGYRVLVARDGAEAVETHTRYKQQISVVILDLGLPKLNGWDALQRMKTADPTLTAILATGHVSPEVESEIKQGKVAGVVLKPYKIDEVLRNISLAIHKHHEDRAGRLQ